MQDDLFNFNSFGAPHQCVRQLVAKDGQEKSQRCDYSQQPGYRLCHRRQQKRAQLNWMFAHIYGDQGHAERKHQEPPIIDAHGYAIDPRHQDLTLEEALESHGSCECSALDPVEGGEVPAGLSTERDVQPGRYAPGSDSITYRSPSAIEPQIAERAARG